MPELGALLDLLYKAHQSVDLMFVGIRDTMPRSASNVLIVETDGDATVRGLRWADGGPSAQPVVSARRVWFEPPSREQVEALQAERW